MNARAQKAIYRTAKVLSAIGALAAIPLIGVPAPAHTAPPGLNDPHMPNAEFNYCPGGGSGLPGSYWCDGEPYADGSFWHMFKQAHTWHAYCVIDKGDPLPPPAPPGGCDGAV